MNIWSTADGSGELRVKYDFSAAVQVYESFCTADRSTCLFSAIEPGFMAPPLDAPPSGLFRIVDGATLRVQIISIDAGLSLNVNGNKLSQAGESALLGTMPTIHVHPSWQIVIPGSQAGRELNIAFKIVASNGSYSGSPAIVARVLAVGDSTPTPTPTPTWPASDCNHDDVTTVDELVTSIRVAHAEQPVAQCDAADRNGDSSMSMDELEAAIEVALQADLTPASFAEIQDTIFTPRCATLFCHDTQGHNGNLVLSSGQAYEQLVNVEPDTLSARNDGLLRVLPGDAERSFLLIKVVGPPPSQGSRMPLTGDPLTSAETDLIRRWILQGAQR